MGDIKCLNVTLLSAQGLKDVCTFGKMSPYAKAWIDPSAKQRTPIATNAGCTPVWGHKLCLPLPPNALTDEKVSLSIQIWSQGSASDTIVGSANLPLVDLITSTNPNGLEFMACQLLRPSGRVQGLVNFSLEISDKVLQALTSSKDSRESCKDSSSTNSGASTTKGSFSGDKNSPQSQDAHGSGKVINIIHTDSKDKAKVLNLRSGKTMEAAPDALGDGHGNGTLPDARDLKSGTRYAKSSATPDALDLSQGDGSAVGFHTSANGSGDGPQSSLPGFGGTMFGGVIGALLLGESVQVKSDGPGNHSGSHGGVGDRGLSDPGAGGSATGVPAP